ncbi:hypothetical protein ACYJ1Y_15435 [Natrialbaceae archaeon A-gly3]
MATVPAEVLAGISFGALLAVLPAIVVVVVTVGVGQIREVRPHYAVFLAIAFPIAASLSYVMGVFGGDVLGQVPRIGTAATVVGLAAVYAGNQGWEIATEIPRASVPIERGRPLSADAIDAIDTAGQVTVTASGDLRELEGYPPLPPELRRELENGRWRLPADLPLEELARRLEARLRTEYRLAGVSVSVDPQGRASITAAPPRTGVDDSVPAGCRAVTLTAMCPAGLARGDAVLVHTDDSTVEGTVVSAHTLGASDTFTEPGDDGDELVAETDDPYRRPRLGVDGGVGRVTVTVPTMHVAPLLERERVRLIVPSSGTNADIEAVSALERTDTSIREVEIDAEIASQVRTSDDAAILAVRTQNGEGRETAWSFDPADVSWEDVSTAFVAGPATTLDRLGIDGTTGVSG